MTNITLASPVFYKKGQAGVSAVVGYESASNRVARYSFVAPDGGATAVSLAFSGNWTGRGEKPKLAFYIGTDPDSHGNAGKGSTATGALTLQPDYYSYAGSAELLLLPGETYYIWVFPTTAVFGWLQWGYDPGDAVITLSGAAISHISASDGVLGEEMTVNITRYGDHSHTVTCTFGAETVTLCENSVETALSWTPPLELAWQIPDSASGRAVFTVQTQELGAMSCAVTLSVPQSLAPAVAFSWENSCTAGLYRSLSALTVAVEAEGRFGAELRSEAVTLDGRPYSGGALQHDGSHILAVTVTDSRGLTATASQTLTVLPYDRPRVSLSGSRCDEDGTPNDMGEFARLTAEATVFIPPARLTLEGQTVEAESISCIVPASSVRSPLFTATVTDGVGGTQTAEFRLAIGYATLDFLAGGRGIAFGTTATEEGFVCAMPAKFLGGVEGLTPFTESTEHPGCFLRTVEERTEWLNPPMLVGVEYCTPERCNGLPVYTKLVELGALPNNATKYVDSVVGGGWSGFLDVRPVAAFDTKDLKVTGNGDGKWAWLTVTATADLSGKTAQCILKYLK